MMQNGRIKMAGEEEEEPPTPTAVGIGPMLVPTRAVVEEEEVAIVHGPAAMPGENPWMGVTPPPPPKHRGSMQRRGGDPLRRCHRTQDHEVQ